MAYSILCQPLEDWECRVLSDAARDDRERLIVAVILGSGLRISEFRALRREDLYPDRGYAVAKNLKRGGTKQVPVTPQAMLLLLSWLAGRHRVGYSSQWWWVILKRVAARAGVSRNVNPRVLRHTFAVRALRSGVDIRSLQAALGHSALAITEQYLKYSDDAGIRAFREHGWMGGTEL